MMHMHNLAMPQNKAVNRLACVPGATKPNMNIRVVFVAVVMRRYSGGGGGVGGGSGGGEDSG